jgi:hypothetical protein
VGWVRIYAKGDDAPTTAYVETRYQLNFGSFYSRPAQLRLQLLVLTITMPGVKMAPFKVTTSHIP